DGSVDPPGRRARCRLVDARAPPPRRRLRVASGPSAPLVPRGLPSSAFDLTIEEAQVAATALGKPVEVLHAGTSRDIEAVFASLTQKRVDALMVIAHYLFMDRRVQLTTSPVRYAMPTILPNRRDAEFGGLMS